MTDNGANKGTALKGLSPEADLAVTALWQTFDESYAELVRVVRRLEQEPLSLYERRELLTRGQSLNRQCVSILEAASKALREQVFEAPAHSTDAGGIKARDPFETSTGLVNELQGNASPLTPEEETCLQNYEKNLQELDKSVQTLEEMSQPTSAMEPHPLSIIMQKVTHVAHLSYETSRAEKLIMV